MEATERSYRKKLQREATEKSYREKATERSYREVTERSHRKKLQMEATERSYREKPQIWNRRSSSSSSVRGSAGLWRSRKHSHIDMQLRKQQTLRLMVKTHHNHDGMEKRELSGKIASKAPANKQVAIDKSIHLR